MAKLPPQPMGVPPGHSYWNDWYEKLRALVDAVAEYTGTGSLVRRTGAALDSPAIDSPLFNTAITVEGSLTGQSVTIPLAKLTGGGTNGDLTFTYGILTSYTLPT